MNASPEPAEIRIRGGLRNKRGAASWPFALLIADATTIVLRGALGGARFDISQNVAISLRNAITGDGLRFAPEDLHSEAVTFYTLPGRRDELVRHLRRLGWTVQDETGYGR